MSSYEDSDVDDSQEFRDDDDISSSQDVKKDCEVKFAVLSSEDVHKDMTKSITEV